ncbi:sulfatase [Candidatus Altiarchaeota archaeon]
MEGNHSSGYGIHLIVFGALTLSLFFSYYLGLWGDGDRLDEAEELIRQVNRLVERYIPENTAQVRYIEWNETKRGTGKTGPNVILVTVEALRPDHMSLYGYERETTPFLDGWGRSQVVFENAFVPSPWTIPSLGSIQTGLYPGEHGATYGYMLDKGMSTLPKTMLDAGYDTFSATHSVHDMAEYGLLKGFMESYTVDHQEVLGNSSSEINRQVKAWLDDNNGPFFIWIHYFEPHFMYNPQPPYDSMYVEGIPKEYKLLNRRYCAKNGFKEDELEWFAALYDGEVRYFDESFKGLMGILAERGLADNTIIAVTSDHGEEFNDHGGCDHGASQYDEVIHVPLILSIPSKEGRVIDHQAPVKDLAATLLHYADISVHKVGGESLHTIVEGMEGGRPIYSAETRYGPELKAVRTDGLKLIITEGAVDHELYDLADDQGETENLYHARGDVASALMEELDGWVKKTRPKGRSTKARISDEAKEKLKDAGYIS